MTTLRRSPSPRYLAMSIALLCLFLMPQPTLAIQNGIKVNYASKYPFYVALQYPHLCGGSLISVNPFWVVTAAHCVLNATLSSIPDPNPYYVCMGSHDTSQQQCATIRAFHVHPKYYNATTGVTNVTHDIALIEVEAVARGKKSQILPGSNIWPIPIYWEKGIDEITIGVTMGMGYASLNSTSAEKYLHELKVTVTAINSTNPSMIETSSPPGTGVCHGDSGGPLILNDDSSQPFLLGVTSIILDAYDPDPTKATCTVQENVTADAHNIFCSTGYFVRWLSRVTGISADQLVTPQSLPTITNPVYQPTTVIVTDVETISWYSIGPSGTELLVSTTTRTMGVVVEMTTGPFSGAAARVWDRESGWGRWGWWVGLMAVVGMVW
ncbi:trypsin-like cysteine/serine peptidase domain-containing protein [Jimgerdemannia flammicorona]|uniref:Trypsin-like cysteine/serine peptidase domain-containing protein n=1 Tax=Jimgerdemannia flammicorona TaxID=994334 RepID=A0A433D0L9_9FUNG|nr:trypsin-like cysteine/serine peptidase domain-containing protein [Jimgerdemannia flammicorona]